MTTTALELRDGDWLVFETNQHVAAQDAERIRRELAETFAHPVDRVVILQGVRLKVVRKDYE